MNYMQIDEFDTANGDGIRVTLFVSGCTHQCKGCHNPQTWDFNAGLPFTNSTQKELIDKMNHSYVTGLTISGGDPLNPLNISRVTEICKKVKETYKNKNIWVYTGYTLKELIDFINIFPIYYKQIYKYIDILIDGEYNNNYTPAKKKFRGSDNQKMFEIEHFNNKVIIKSKDDNEKITIKMEDNE